LLSEYVIIDVPKVTPVTTPEPEPMAATAVLLLVQVPPDIPSLSGVVPAMHADGVPVIAVGDVTISTVVVAIQAEPIV
jgi:hypothetical protein